MVSYCSAIEQNQGAWNRFMNSMRARLNVAQIVEEVKQDATITFDFLTLLIIAGYAFFPDSFRICAVFLNSY